MSYVIEQVDFLGRSRKRRVFFCLSKKGSLDCNYAMRGDRLLRTDGPNSSLLARAHRVARRRDAQIMAALVDKVFRHQDFVWRVKKVRK